MFAMKLEELPFSALSNHEPIVCDCGKTHVPCCGKTVIGRGALENIPELIKPFGAKRVFLLADPNTYRAAGEKIVRILADAGISCTEYVYREERPKPDEVTAGAALMHFDPKCDFIIAVGGGVMNDTGKLLASAAHLPYMIAATAPSMDGFASASSSMDRDGLKISLSTKAADVIIADTEILAQAPMKLIASGLGDMLAKYVSICEWRIARLLIGEPYCEHVASMVRGALRRCTEARDGLLARDPDAVKSVMEGMVIAGVSMNYAGLSRPASGMEHYISHIWDMRGLAFGTNTETHGIQAALGTVLSLRAYAWLRERMPAALTEEQKRTIREKALSYVSAFSLEAWEEQLRLWLGTGAEAIIAGEHREHKYDRDRHAARLEKILDNWETILSVMREELPEVSEVEALMRELGMPLTPREAGFTACEERIAFLCAKDIRDKYVLGRLLWDLGLLEECADAVLSNE